MVWVIIGAILIAMGLLAWLLTRPLKIPREHTREGRQEGEAVIAYDRTSRWPIFSLERSVVINALKREKVEGALVDIGSGAGYLEAQIKRRYPALKVAGLDISAEMIAVSKRNWANSDIDFITGDAQNMPLPESSIDIAVSSLSLHHWADPSQVFREIKRVLKPGGRFIIMDLRRDGWQGIYWVFKLGQKFIAPHAIKETNGAVGSFWSAYTTSELGKIIATAGFTRWGIKKAPAWMVAWGFK
jgi:ubiquinone/menaquinone biosynthesis C-methylase UbiE